jgi:hypothetical protein
MMDAEFEGSAEKCQIVGVKPNGERIVISNHESQQMARHALRLISHGPEFSSMVIEVINPLPE